MGLAASCLATLRPLFREFLSRSRLLGSTTFGNSKMLPNKRASKVGKPSTRGYARDLEKDGMELGEMKGVTVTTVHAGKSSPTGKSSYGLSLARSGGSGEDDWEIRESSNRPIGDSKGITGGNYRGRLQSELDDDEERSGWRVGVKKTISIEVTRETGTGSAKIGTIQREEWN